MQPNIDACLAVSSFTFFMYALAGIIVGFYGYFKPCNRYAQANITWCGPAPELGVFYFDICYSDDQGAIHIGEISTGDIPCSAASLEQHLTICYSLNNPGLFQNNTVGFMNPAIAPAFMISGLAALYLALLCCCLSRRCMECCCGNGTSRYGYNNNDTLPMLAIATVASSTSASSSGPTHIATAHAHGRHHE